MLQTGFVLAVIALVVVVVAVLLAFLLDCTKIWVQAYMCKVPLGLSTIIRMRFCKADPKAVVRALIIAKQGAELDLSPAEVERAYLEGADLDKVTRTLVAVKRAKGNLGRAVEIVSTLTSEEVEQKGLELLRELEDKDVDIKFQELVDANLKRKVADGMPE